MALPTISRNPRRVCIVLRTPWGPGIILLATAVGGGAFLLLGCMVMMGAMVWMKMRPGRDDRGDR